MIQRRLLACAICLSGPLLVFGGSSLRLTGSDIFENWLPKSLDTQISDVPIEYHLIGSEIGLSALKASKADACLYISTENSAPDLPQQFQSNLIAYLVLHVYADSSFPSHFISKDTLLRIADRSSLTPIVHWTEVFKETSDTWKAKPAEVLIDQSDIPFTSAFFRLAFLGSAKPSVRVHLCPFKAQVEDLMNQNRGCIIVSPRSTFYLRDTKQLQLSESSDDAAFPPSYENIAYGDYSARFPIYLLSSGNSPELATLETALKSTAFRDSLRENWLIPAE